MILCEPRTKSTSRLGNRQRRASRRHAEACGRARDPSSQVLSLGRGGSHRPHAGPRPNETQVVLRPKVCVIATMVRQRDGEDRVGARPGQKSW